MSELAIEILIRPYDRESDEPFVMSQWVRGLNRALGVTDRLGVVGWPLTRSLVNALVERCVVLVACSVTFPDHILGWIAVEDNCLHWVYVKADIGIRRQGVGTMLVREALGDCGQIVASVASDQCSPGQRVWEKWRLRLDRRRLESSNPPEKKADRDNA